MTEQTRLSPQDRRAVLETLSRDRLAELTTRFDLEVSDRRSTRAHVDAMVRKRSLDFRSVLGLLLREELQRACQVLGLDTGGREKAVLIDRILAPVAGLPEEVVVQKQQIAPTRSSAPPAEGVVHEGALKSALRRFAVELAGGVRGKGAPTEFCLRLLQCFGWGDAGPPEAKLSASLAVVENGQRTTREIAMVWSERRVLVEVVKHDMALDVAWKELLRVCLQADPVPQYVVLTNQRDLHLYDLVRDREAPRLSIPIHELPKYSEAFPFLAVKWVPGTLPKIINVSKVSGEVADLVARLYRSLKEQHPERERDVVQFTLQCILAMFAEDIGLLPQEYFTTLLYEGARAKDVEARLTELFRLMSTRDVPGPRAVPYFNGGLFTNPVSLPLGDAQLAALTKASEANWKYVDPHIFGSVFQGIMSDAERHKSGAHYTAHEDIMRVVGPTIVEPWRKRIRAAATLGELLEVRSELLKFRVLDPACGSGNFLYVAFREMYALDTELLGRLREFVSTHSGGNAKITWGAGIQASNFYGIDINPFAVELAKVTLNIAKKIAFDERREFAADLMGQMELEVDPSLPLDNLEKNIVCADALFTEWPEADAIVGNPPFLGAMKIRRELGAEYLGKLLREGGSSTAVDLACYWFRRAHDRLAAGARAGLVGTSGIRVGAAREASLDYVVANGGTITNAVSSRAWQGDAAVNVSMVNWIKGAWDQSCTLVVDDKSYDLPNIATHLQLHTDTSVTRDIAANGNGAPQGVSFGHPGFRAGPGGFYFGKEAAVRPRAGADDMLRGRLAIDPEDCIYFEAKSEDEARRASPHAFAHLREEVYPLVKSRAESGKETGHYKTWLRRWWMPQQARESFMRGLAQRARLLVCPRVMARPVFAFLSTRFVPDNTLILFSLEDDYSFGLMQSRFHWEWARAKGSRVTERIQYTTGVWAAFPWPQEPSESEVAAVALTARTLRETRDVLMSDNGWSLRTVYQAAEVPGPHPLKDAQDALDDAVRAAYGMPADQEATEFLLELNKLVAEDEAAGHPVQGPGVPRGLDPRDPRWMSDDCIQPPKP